MLVFATALAAPTPPTTFTANLDEDGTVEIVDVYFDSDKHLIVDVEERDRRRRLDLGLQQDIMGPRDEVQVTSVEKADTGVPMLKLHVPRGEYCGSGNTWIYVSYVNDTPVEALQVADWSDAPVWTSVETRFDPKHRSVKVVHRYGNEDGPSGKAAKKLKFVDGIYK